jgi:hypothetical protein
MGFGTRLCAGTRARVQVSATARWYGVNARIERGQLAIRTLTGRSLLYTEATDSVKVRLLTAKGCF